MPFKACQPCPPTNYACPPTRAPSPQERAAALRAAPRRSKRLTGERVDYFEIDDDDRPVVRATGADASDALLPGLDEPAELVDLLGGWLGPQTIGGWCASGG